MLVGNSYSIKGHTGVEKTFWGIGVCFCWLVMTANVWRWVLELSYFSLTNSSSHVFLSPIHNFEGAELFDVIFIHVWSPG